MGKGKGIPCRSMKNKYCTKGSIQLLLPGVFEYDSCTPISHEDPSLFAFWDSNNRMGEHAHARIQHSQSKR